MTPTTKGLEDKLAGLIAQLAVTNESMMQLNKLAEKHENVIFGTTPDGGLVSAGNTLKHTVQEHTEILDRLEKSCSDMMTFMEAQVEINKARDHSLTNLNRVVMALAGAVFIVLLLIGVADISALHTLLTGVQWP